MKIPDHICSENLIQIYKRKVEQFYEEEARCIQAVQVLHEDGQKCSVCEKVYYEE